MRRNTEAVPSTLRKINVRSTLEILKRNGECSRAMLTKLSGVSAPTMFKLLNDLLKVGMIEEIGRDPQGKGRPSKYYRLAEKKVCIIGVAIDICECRFAVAGLDGRIEAKDVDVVPMAAGDYPGFIDAVAVQVRKYLFDPAVRCAGVGVSVPGLIGRDGVVELAPNIHMFNGKNIEADLKQLLELPVMVMQEEYGMCLAEQSFGAAGECTDFLLVDVSSGLGMGALCDNRYVRGAFGFGGELGHITVKADGPRCGCGNHGCLETLGGDKAMAVSISARLGREVKPYEIVDAVKASGIDIRAELEESLDYLAIGVAAAINIFNPAIVFLYGRLFDLGEDAFSRFSEKVGRRALAPSFFRCQLRRASVSKEQGAIAGIVSHLFEKVGPKLDVGF